MDRVRRNHAELWANSASFGSWINAASTNLSFTATGLTLKTPCDFTLRATNAVDTLRAASAQSFTIPVALPPPTAVLPVNRVRVTNGLPSVSFTVATGWK
jgi:hypothetical protein